VKSLGSGRGLEYSLFVRGTSIKLLVCGPLSLSLYIYISFVFVFVILPAANLFDLEKVLNFQK
jgi:hypothetical protein